MRLQDAYAGTPGPLSRRARNLSAGLKSVLDPFHRRSRPERIGDDHHVEAHRQARQLGALLQQLARGARDAPLLDTSDARRRAVGLRLGRLISLRSICSHSGRG